MKMERWPLVQGLMDEKDDPGTPSGGLSDDLPSDPSGKGGKRTTDSDDPPTHSEGQTPFKHPALVGLSEEQIAEQLAVSRATIKSQGTRLSTLESEYNRLRQGGQPPAPVDEPDEDIDSTAFFTEPGKHLPKMVSKVVKKELQDIVGPLIKDLGESKRQGAWQTVAGRHENFETYRSYIEEKLREWGLVGQETPQLIETIYYQGVGEAFASGNLRPSGDGSERGGAGPNPNIQHRPSSQPIKPDKPSKKKRELTEEERFFARQNGMSPDDYLDWLEADEDKIAESTIGVTKEGDK